MEKNKKLIVGAALFIMLVYFSAGFLFSTYLEDRENERKIEKIDAAEYNACLEQGFVDGASDLEVALCVEKLVK